MQILSLTTWSPRINLKKTLERRYERPSSSLITTTRTRRRTRYFVTSNTLQTWREQTQIQESWRISRTMPVVRRRTIICRQAIYTSLWEVNPSVNRQKPLSLVKGEPCNLQCRDSAPIIPCCRSVLLISGFSPKWRSRKNYCTNTRYCSVPNIQGISAWQTHGNPEISLRILEFH